MRRRGSYREARLSAGDWVEVRPRAEILATLDADGCLDNLPFMPEMFGFCGQRLRVWKRAHKTCDTVNRTGGRRMSAAVHLEGARCDGAAHGGCGAACLLFWKEAWLRPLSTPGGSQADASRVYIGGEQQSPCNETTVARATRAADAGPEDDPVYRCQATDLPRATSPLPWWDARQYWEDWRSGNESPRRLLSGALYVCVFFLARRNGKLGRLYSPTLRRLYDHWQRLTGGTPYPRRTGTIPVGHRTPASVPLGLQSGDLARVKPYEAILQTLDGNNRNRGLFFDAEEVPFCGRTYPVRSVVTRIIDERTGKMLHLRGANVTLDGPYCQALYSNGRMFCPRAVVPIWRETWLERPNELACAAPSSDAPLLAAD